MVRSIIVHDAILHRIVVHNAIVHSIIVHNAIVHRIIAHNAIVHSIIVHNAIVHSIIVHNAHKAVHNNFTSMLGISEIQITGFVIDRAVSNMPHPLSPSLSDSGGIKNCYDPYYSSGQRWWTFLGNSQ